MLVEKKLVWSTSGENILELYARTLRTEQRNKSVEILEQDPIDENVIQHPTRILDMNQSGAAPNVSKESWVPATSVVHEAYVDPINVGKI